MRVVDVSARSGIDWIRQAFALFRAAPGGWITLFFCWAALILLMVLLLQSIGQVLALMLQPALFGGLVIAARDQEAGAPVTPAHLFAGFRANGRALVVVGSIAMLAEILLAMALEMLGMPRAPIGANGLPDFAAFSALLAGKEWLVIAGLCVAMLIKMVLWFTAPLLALNVMPVGAAVRWSCYAFIANFLPLLVFTLLMLPLLLLAALPGGLGLLLWMPLFAIAHYCSYRQVFQSDPVSTPEPNAP